MTDKKQVSVSISEKEWEIAKREAKKVNKKPTRWIRSLICSVEQEASVMEMEA